MNEINFLETEQIINPSTRPIIFIAGPYTPLLNRPTSFNRAIADEYGRQIFRATQGKCDIFIPHNCYAHWEEYGFKDKPIYEWFLSFDLRILSISEAIYMLPLWDKSNGARLEMKFAVENDIKVLHSIQEVKEWFNKLFPLSYKPEEI